MSTTEETRIERDSMGEMQVPGTCLLGCECPPRSTQFPD